MISTFSFPTKVTFGPGAIEHVAEVARSFDMKHPLVVTDPGIVKCRLLERLTEPLNKAGLRWALFDRVEATLLRRACFPASTSFRVSTATV